MRHVLSSANGSFPLRPLKLTIDHTLFVANFRMILRTVSVSFLPPVMESRFTFNSDLKVIELQPM